MSEQPDTYVGANNNFFNCLADKIKQDGVMYSQSEISRETGVPQPLISRMMRGEYNCSILQLDYAYSLATWLGVEVQVAFPPAPPKPSS